MASLTLGTWVWASSGRWWTTKKPGVLQFMGLQTVGHDWMTEQQQHSLNGHKQTLEDSEGQGSLAHCSPWGCKESDTTEWLNNNNSGFAVVKNLPANVGDAGDGSSISGSGRSLGVENGNLLQYPCLKIPWTEEPDRLQRTGLQRVKHSWVRKRSASVYHESLQLL